MSRQDHFQSGKYQRSSKLFITNLPPDLPQDTIRNQIQPLFQNFGKINSINVKKHKSGQYSYCFLQFDRIQDAIRAIQDMDQKIIHERPMKVRQDRQGDGCFNCKKSGHFAKQCPLKQENNRQDKRHRRRSNDRDQGRYQNAYRQNRRPRDYQRRSRSRSFDDSRDRHQKKRRRSRSRQYSPPDQYRRRQRDYQRRRDRYRRSKSRSPRSRSPRSPRKPQSPSDSYQNKNNRYNNNNRRRENYQRDQRRENRQYRHRSPSSSYDKQRR